MSILVIGGTGFVGGYLVKFLVDQGRKVVAYDRLPPIEKDNILHKLKDSFVFKSGDVTDLSYLLHVIKEHHVEGVVNCAALVANTANEHPIEALNVNIIGSANVLEAARIMGLGRIVLVSSSAAMGAPEDLETPRKEEETVLPAIGVYPLSKLAIEHLVATYRKLFGVSAVAIRPRAVYGPGVTRHHLLPMDQIVREVVKGGPFKQESGADSSFDVTYVKDLAKGLALAYDKRDPKHCVYNISFGQNIKMSSVAKVLKSHFPNQQIELGPGPWPGVLPKGAQTDSTYRRSQRPPQDIAKAREDLGYSPEWPVERAIPDWVAWLKNITKEE